MKKTYIYFFAMFISLIRRMKKCFSLKELCLKHQEKHEHALHDIRMLTIGLEPITYKEQILSLSCLPISPSKHRKKYVSLEKTHVSSLQKVYRWGTSSPEVLALTPKVSKSAFGECSFEERTYFARSRSDSKSSFVTQRAPPASKKCFALGLKIQGTLRRLYSCFFETKETLFSWMALEKVSSESFEQGRMRDE